MTVVRVSRAPCSSGCSDAANSIPSVCFVEAVPAPPSFDDTMISNFSMRLVHDFTHEKSLQNFICRLRTIRRSSYTLSGVFQLPGQYTACGIRSCRLCLPALAA